LLMLFPLLGTLPVVLRRQEQKPLQHVVGNPLTDPTGSSHQARLPLPPLRIPTLHPTRLSRALVTGLMLTRSKRGEEARVRSPMIRAHRLVLVVGGNVRPTQRQHRVGPIAQG